MTDTGDMWFCVQVKKTKQIEMESEGFFNLLFIEKRNLKQEFCSFKAFEDSISMCFASQTHPVVNESISFYVLHLSSVS